MTRASGSGITIIKAVGRSLGALGHLCGMIFSRHELKRTEHGQRFVTLMEGNSFDAIFAAFENHADGEALLETLPDTERMLADRADLGRRPAGSFARSYLDFLIANAFDPAVYSDVARTASVGFSTNLKRTWLRHRIDAIHDARHVLTGYGAELLGEACLLAFRAGQVRHRGVVVVSVVAAIGSFFTHGPLGTLRAMTEAYRRGRSATLVDLCPFELDLSAPLESCRARLGLTPPQVYQALVSDRPRRSVFKRRQATPLHQEPSL